MAQKQDWSYWKTGLHKGSDALEDLDSLAHDLGVSRAEATRFLLVAFSKARRGEWNMLFCPPAVHSAAAPQQSGLLAATKDKDAQARRSKGAAFAAALDLDD
jgi:hypothetical protein